MYPFPKNTKKFQTPNPFFLFLLVHSSRLQTDFADEPQVFAGELFKLLLGAFDVLAAVARADDVAPTDLPPDITDTSDTAREPYARITQVLVRSIATSNQHWPTTVCHLAINLQIVAAHTLVVHPVIFAFF